MIRKPVPAKPARPRSRSRVRSKREADSVNFISARRPERPPRGPNRKMIGGERKSSGENCLTHRAVKRARAASAAPQSLPNRRRAEARKIKSRRGPAERRNYSEGLNTCGNVDGPPPKNPVPAKPPTVPPAITAAAAAPPHSKPPHSGWNFFSPVLAMVVAGALVDTVQSTLSPSIPTCDTIVCAT